MSALQCCRINRLTGQKPAGFSPKACISFTLRSRFSPEPGGVLLRTSEQRAKFTSSFLADARRERAAIPAVGTWQPLMGSSIEKAFPGGFQVRLTLLFRLLQSQPAAASDIHLTSAHTPVQAQAQAQAQARAHALRKRDPLLVIHPKAARLASSSP